MSINISGAVDLRVIDYNNRRFILFSDIHGGFTGLCPEQCLDIKANVDELGSIEGDNICHTTSSFHLDCEKPRCYTVDGAIKKIISEANNNGEYVDVFFESNFYGDPPHRTLIINPSDPLDITTRAYRNCLYIQSERDCPYSNARFHYTDIRQGISKSSIFLGLLPNLMDIVRYINKLSLFVNIQNNSDTLSNYLYFFVNNYILRLFISSSTTIDTNLWAFLIILLKSTNYVIDVNGFLNRILVVDTDIVNKFIRLLGKKFTTINSSRISSTLMKLLESTFQKLRTWSLEPTMIVSRNNKIMSRIKAQLDGLDNQGDNILGDKLEQYIYQKIQAVSISQLYNMLNLQYDHVLRYIQTPTTTDKSMKYKQLLQRKLPENPLLHITSFTMDLYTIARMFRTFPTQYRKNPLRSSEKHITSSYVIVYEGKAHINTITDFLQLIGATINVYNPIPNYQRCINILNNDFIKTTTNI